MQPVTTPRVFSGRYELTHMVARGGMAQVYRAHDRLLDRPVALKVLFPELSVDRAFVERFRREAQAAANLSHPNIVPVFDWGEDTGTYYIVMEFVDGQPLSALLRQSGPLPPRRVAQIGARVADALAYAHRHGVVHRDVKPGNVLLTNDEQVKVTDFGIARAVNTEESLTQTGAVMGTATYFSPEQAEGIGVDARSDIYSLGVVLFEMIAGRPPFLGETPVSIASKHVRDQPPPLRELNPTVPPALEAVVAKAMAKSPDLRYQTASDLRADLLRYLEGRPVEAGDAETTRISGLGDAGVTGVIGSVVATQAIGIPEGRPVLAGPTPRRSSTSKWAIALVVLLVILVVVAILVLRSLGYLGASNGFALPTQRGKTPASAAATLDNHGLDVTGTRSVESSTVTATHVVGTDPAAGATVKKGQHVALLISTGPAATVPDVKTKTLTAAVALIQGATLTPKTKTQQSTKPNGTVLAQTPAANTKVKRHSAVTLTVSSQNAVVVPSVVGTSSAAAGSRLGQVGLTVGTPAQQCSTKYGSGQVSAQTPAANKQVAPKTPVNLVISSGPCQAVVPTVRGQTVTAAKQTLSSKGFTKVATTPTTLCSAGTVGKITSQTPSGGKSAATSSTVTLSVCNAPPPTSSTTTTTTGSSGPTTTTTSSGTNGNGNSGG